MKMKKELQDKQFYFIFIFNTYKTKIKNKKQA